MAEERENKSRSIVNWFFASFALFCFLIFCSLHMYGGSASTATLENFFLKVHKGSLQDILPLLSAELRKQNDEQLTALFIKQITQQFGPFQRSEAKSFIFAKKIAAGHEIEQINGPIVFAKRTIDMQLQFLDGKLNVIQIKDADAIRKLVEASKAPPDLGPYLRLGAHFFKWSIEKKYDRAYNLLSPFVREKLSKEQFEANFSKLPRPGSLQKVSHLRAFPLRGHPDRVRFTYKCSFSSGKTIKGEVIFQFATFKSFLNSFKIPI